jgi:hypothetical protein
LDKEHKQIIKDLEEILIEFDSKKYSILEFAARRYVASLRLECYSASDWEALNSKLRGLYESAERILRLELSVFVVIAAIYFEMVKSISYGGVELIASNSALVVFLVVFSFLNFFQYIIEQKATMLSIAAKTIVAEKSDLDPSGTWFAESELRKKMPLNYLFDMLNSEVPKYSWNFIFFVFFTISLSLSFSFLLMLVPFIILSSAFHLCETNAWTFQYKVLFFNSCLSIFARLFAVSIENSLRFKIGGGARRKKFWKDANKYGLKGAMNILKDEVHEEHMRSKIEFFQTKRSTKS